VSSRTDELETDVADPGTRGGDAGVLFAGDTGELPVDARRVLVQLLLGPALDAQRQTKLWPVLLRDELILRSRLHELFLDLVIDYDQGVAFTRQVSDDALDVPILLRKAPLTFIQSSLLLFLRQQLIQADARGERAVVSRQDMLAHLRAFEPDRNVDRAKFERQANGAVERADQLNLLRRLRGEDERYEVSPALKLIFPAEEIQALTDAYSRLCRGGADSAPGRTAGAGEEEL
jgi:hypothetical protein